MYVMVIGLNHRTAPVEVRERLAFGQHELPPALRRLRAKPMVQAAVILSTCNRTEIYVASTDVEEGLVSAQQFVCESCSLPLNEIRPYLYVHTLYDAVRHLFRVASGLDSMILGETQILGQVRAAYEIARDNGATNAIMNTLFQQAITVGKRVRTETAIDQNAVSVSYAAVDLAKHAFGILTGRSVLVVGAGKMSELTIQYLVSNGVSTVLVSNRSFDRAEILANRFGGRAVRFDQLMTCMEKADIVISCTAASHFILHYPTVQEVMMTRSDRPLVIIDIAVPRDVEPEVGRLPGVKLYDIDDLRQVIDENLETRKKAAQKAESIIETEMDDFFRWLSTLSVVPTIVALKEKANRIKEAELARALNRLAPVSDREKKVIGSMASSIVNQLLHDPIINLKAYTANSKQGHMCAEILQNLFNLEVPGQERIAWEMETTAADKKK